MQKYSKEERDKQLTEWRKSDLSRQEYCRRNNIRTTTFYGWIKKRTAGKNKKRVWGNCKNPCKSNRERKL